MMRYALLVAAALAIAACGSKNEDRLDDNQLADVTARAPKADTRCGAAATAESLKRELFARAAEVRGSHADNYAKIAGFALLVVDAARPVAPAVNEESVDCRGRATLRLPPNLKVAGGSTSLAGTIAYTVSAGTRPTVTLGAADAIVLPLATLSQARAAPPALSPAVPPVAPSPPPGVGPENAAAAPGNPSFDCERARTNSEYAVCANPALGALDRAMSQQYRSAISRADPDQARLLGETRDRFLGFRNACGSDSCIAQTYRGRMREVDDIMAGRWQPPR